jgi:CelD/BcsL family acetyltransferase involved in cellulose biosynthesis
LTLDNKIIAAHFGFTWDRRIYYYKPCYDPSLSSHSPGKVLLAYLIQDAITRGIQEVDFLYGLEDYKQDYTSEIRRTSSFLIQKSRLGTLARRLRGRAPVRIDQTRMASDPDELVDTVQGASSLVPIT